VRGHQFDGVVHVPDGQLELAFRRAVLVTMPACMWLRPNCAVMNNSAPGVVKVWNDHSGWSARDRELAVGSTFRLSWSATISQLRNLNLIEYEEFRILGDREPRSGDYVRRELSWDALLDTDMRLPVKSGAELFG
jgi:hypothetical protein